MADEKQLDAESQEAVEMSEEEARIESEASEEEKASPYGVKMRHENEKRRIATKKMLEELAAAKKAVDELNEIKDARLKEQNDYKTLSENLKEKLAKAEEKLSLIDADNYLLEAEAFVENGIKTLDDVHRDLINKCASVIEKKKFLERLAAKKAESAPREQKPAGSISFSAPKNRKEFEQLSPVEQDKFAAEHPDELKEILRT